MRPRDVERLIDTLGYARRAAARIEGATREEFDADDDLQIVMIYLIQTVGEAASQVSGETRQALPQVPWREIVGMRQRLVHAYLTVQIDRVWATAARDLPALIATLEPLVPPEES